jgi:hypothetical protein
MHTVSNKQAIANKTTSTKVSFFCEARAHDLGPGKTLTQKWDFLRAFPNKCVVGKCIWKIEPLG